VSNARWKICDQLEVFRKIQNYIHHLEDFLKKNVGKYPKVDNSFPTAVDFPRKIKKFPKSTSSYDNVS
jgi:hypothetical protein